MKRFEAMFSSGYDTIMYDGKGLRRDEDIGWNYRWSSLRMYCSVFADPRGYVGHAVISSRIVAYSRATTSGINAPVWQMYLLRCT